MGKESGIIDGFGCVFLYSNKPAELVAWYERHFDMAFTPYEDNKNYGAEFVTIDSVDPKEKKATLFSIQKRKDQLPEGVRIQQTLNFRVVDLGAVVNHLVAKGAVIDSQSAYDFGKFASLKDGDGNQIELFEPL